MKEQKLYQYIEIIFWSLVILALYFSVVWSINKDEFVKQSFFRSRIYYSCFLFI